MSWLDVLDMYDETLDFFTRVYDIILQMLSAMNRATIYLDSIDFTESVMATYLGYFRFVAGDILFFALLTGAQIALGITLWKLLLRGVGFIKNLLPW